MTLNKKYLFLFHYFLDNYQDDNFDVKIIEMVLVFFPFLHQY